MKTLVILNCVDDAKHFMANFEYADTGNLLVSTHPSVNDYLEYNNASCRHLADYISYDKIKEVISETESVVNELLIKLDARFSILLNNMLEIDSLRWFYALYRYMGKNEYLGMRKAQESLNNIIRNENFEKILIYRSVKTGYYERDNNIIEIIKLLHNNCSIIDNKGDVRDYAFTGKYNKGNTARGSFRNLYHKYIVSLAAKLTEVPDSFIFRVYKYMGKKKDILLFLPLSNLSFLKLRLKKRAILVDSEGRGFSVELSKEEKNKLNEMKKTIDNKGIAFEESGLRRIFLKNIISDFCQNLEYNFSVIKGLDLYNRKYLIKLGIWDNPPAWKAKALIIEYLLRKDICVIGAQHGFGYCEVNTAWTHFDSDFNWCRYYLSYGFDEKDLKEVYPDREKICQIVPSGYIKRPKENLKEREKIDLLFPITNSASLMTEGVRIKNSDLVDIQRQLLLFLNNFSDRRVVVKPHMFSNDKNSAVLWLSSRKLNNLEAISDLTLSQVISRYEIKAFLIEHLSAPIYEAMAGCQDSEIFILNNTSFEYAGFTPKFRKRLEKDLHIFDNIEMLKYALENYFRGTYEKNDTARYRREYLEKTDMQENVLALINKVYNN